MRFTQQKKTDLRPCGPPDLRRDSAPAFGFHLFVFFLDLELLDYTGGGSSKRTPRLRAKEIGLGCETFRHGVQMITVIVHLAYLARVPVQR